MSLLLDALKRAEQAKKAKSDEAALGAVPSGAPDMPRASQRPIEKRVPYAGPERRELQLTDRDADSPPLQTAQSSPSALAKSPIATDATIPVPAAAPIRRANVSTARAPGSAPAATEARPEAAPSIAPINREIAKPTLVGKSPAAAAPVSRASRAPWLAPLIAVAFVAAGAAGWYGWQELSRSLSTTTNRVQPRPETATASPTTGPIVATAPPSPSVSVAAATEPSVPPLLPPPLASAAPLRSLPITRASNAQERPRELTERERLAQSLKQSPSGREAPVRLRLSQSIDAPKVSAELATAYASLTRGDYTQAKNLYLQVVQAMPLNLDAQLGLAASSARSGDNALAARHYRRALELDPRNSMAITGLLAVSESSTGARPEALEAQLKTLISKDANAAPLQFALGNLYAQERRWTEAQQAFFEAYRLDSANADYLFNLAVSLDQLNQPRLAFDYYQKSLAQASKTGAQFDRGVAQRRAAELQNVRAVNQ
jgi:Tfp pilus assembly protein PilF